MVILRYASRKLLFIIEHAGNIYLYCLPPRSLLNKTGKLLDTSFKVCSGLFFLSLVVGLFIEVNGF